MQPILPDPTFLSVTGYTYTGPFKYATPMNPDYFATDETAMKLMSAFGARSLEKRPQIAGPMVVMIDGTADVACENWLVFGAFTRLLNPDGSAFYTEERFTENAGLMAAFFKRNPEASFPDPVFGSLAAKMVWAELKQKYEGR